MTSVAPPPHMTAATDAAVRVAAAINSEPATVSNNIGNTNHNSNRMSARNTARLFVGQLNFEAAEYDVRQIFSFYGHVLHVNILRDEDRKSTGSAFVTFGSTDEADTAIQALHDHYSMGRDRPLQVSYCRRSEAISDFGYQHAVELREINKSNPLPPPRA